MASLKLIEYTSQRRQQASSISPANLTEPDISDEDYFCWRWSLQRFFEGQDMMQPDSKILDSILASRELRSFLLERSTHYNEHDINRFLWHLILEIYGDDPRRLTAIWTWSQSLEPSEIYLFNSFQTQQGQHASEPGFWERLESIFSHLENETKDLPRIGSIWEQLWKDAKRVESLKSNNDNFALNSESLACIASLKQRRLYGGLMHFLNGQYTTTLVNTTLERIKELRLWGPDAYPDHWFLSSFVDLDEAQKHRWDLSCETIEIKNPLWRPEQRQPERLTVVRPALLSCVAGAGKSQRLFDYLSMNVGHYLVSGKAPSEDKSSTKFLNPHRRLTSQDTKFLSEIKDDLNLDGYRSQRLWKVLLLNRQNTLSHFKRERTKIKDPSTESKFEPHQWLLFQTACTKDFDPFLKSFKILLLVDGLSVLDRVKLKSDAPPIFCFDEIQCELTDESVPLRAGEYRVMYRGRVPRTLDDIMEEIPRGSQGKFTNTKSPFIGAGSSLQFLRCKDILSNNSSRLASPDLWSNINHVGVTVIDNLPTIANDCDFHELFHRYLGKLTSRMGYLYHLGRATERHKLWDLFATEDPESGVKDWKMYTKFHNLFEQFKKNNPNRSLVEIVVHLEGILRGRACCTGSPADNLTSNLALCSSIFRGRIRWSTLLIESILTGLLTKNSPGRLQSEDYVQRSKVAQENIKAQLVARIEELKQKGHHFLVKDLYQTAVRAHLLHRPSIFQDMESAQMITWGFASLKRSQGTTEDGGSLKQELAEPLVLQAVIEHLQKQNGRHEQILRELLYDNQDDPSTFGKVTEYYIAWAFGGLLLKEDDVPHIKPNERESFINILKAAVAIPRTSDGLDSPSLGSMTKSGPLEGYTIEQADPSQENDIPLGSPMNFHVWLRRITAGEYFPTFYFPSNFAGPDIVFCLKHPRRGMRRILCAIQVKTGGTKISTEDSFKVIRTVDPNLWFQGQATKKRRRLVKALWANRKRFTILTLLVVTSLSVEDFFTGADDLVNRLVMLRNPVRKYSLEFDQSFENGERMQNLIDIEAGHDVARRKVERLITTFLRDKSKAPHHARIINAAKTVIQNDGKGSIKAAKKKETRIRGAMAISPGEFASMFQRCVSKDEAEIVARFTTAHNTLQSARTMKNGALQEAESILKNVSELKSTTQEQQEQLKDVLGATESMNNNYNEARVFDFFFGILENKDLRAIFDSALPELINAMKKLEDRQQDDEDNRASEDDSLEGDSSESEGDDEISIDDQPDEEDEEEEAALWDEEPEQKPYISTGLKEHRSLSGNGLLQLKDRKRKKNDGTGVNVNDKGDAVDKDGDIDMT